MADLFAESLDDLILVFLYELSEDRVFICCVTVLIFDVQSRLIDARVVLIGIICVAQQAHVALVDIHACPEATCPNLTRIEALRLLFRLICSSS